LQIFGQRRIFDFIQRLGQKGERQQISCLFVRHAARPQIKQGRFIDRTRSGPVRTGHIICINLKLGLSEELAILIQQKRLRNLVAVGFLRAFLNEDLALKHARGPVAQDLFEHLPAFAGQRVMGHENRVVMMERPVTDAGPCHMGNGVVAGQRQNCFIAFQRAIDG